MPATQNKPALNPLEVALAATSEGIISVDAEGRVAVFNRSAERLTGWTAGQAVGLPIAKVFPLTDERTGRRCTAALRRVVKTGAADDLASPRLLIAPDGTRRRLETTVSPIRDENGGHAGAVLVFRDVTARELRHHEHRKAEQLESLGVAAGGIAHDFNNLLTAILGNLSLALYSTGFDQRMHERLTSAKKASLRAQELAQQLLTFAKGGAPITTVTCLAELLADTISFTLSDSNVRAECNIPPDLWMAEVDAGQISQVITNLVVNAQQAMPAGGTLRVDCSNFVLAADNTRLGLTAGRYVKMTFQDEGVGIPDELIHKIFDPYFTTKAKGTGLGLATSYSIVKSHGGVLDVTSTPGGGTTFYIFLRATDALPAPAQFASALQPTHAPGRVLVLDDEEAICALVACALEPLGYEVIETSDGASAVAAYETALREGRRFDLFISDLTIPGGMGGQEAVRRLRELDPQLKAIVSSGYARDPIMSRFREHGFCGMIAKPYEVNALGKVVAEALSGASTANIIHHDFEAKTA